MNGDQGWGIKGWKGKGLGLGVDGWEPKGHMTWGLESGELGAES